MKRRFLLKGAAAIAGFGTVAAFEGVQKLLPAPKKTAGTLNATAVYDDGTLIADTIEDSEFFFSTRQDGKLTAQIRINNDGFTMGSPSGRFYASRT